MEATPTAPTIREVVGRPASARRETIGLLVALAVIALAMTIRFVTVLDDRDTQFVQPYQRLDNVLQGGEVTIYQALLAAMPEVLALRDTEGMWPESVLLEMDMIPPFAKELLPKALRSYEWIGHDGGAWIDYLGVDPTGAHKVSFILRIIDLESEYHPHPHPGVDYDPNYRVASQVWMFPDAERRYPGERVIDAGWWWLIAEDDPLLQQQGSNPVNPKAKNATATDPAAGPQTP
jgi:Family of unknown function (DUF6162)